MKFTALTLGIVTLFSAGTPHEASATTAVRIVTPTVAESRKVIATEIPTENASMSAGESCKIRNGSAAGLRCIRTRDGLRWHEPYEYKDAACDPNDPRLIAANVNLPDVSRHESRISAACVALEWLKNAEVEYPLLRIESEFKLSESTKADLQASARAALRLTWRFRGLKKIDPTVVIATSHAEHCRLVRRLQFPNEAQRVYAGVNCQDERPFSCDLTFPTAFAIMWNPINSKDQRSAGYKASACRVEGTIGLSHHKFWQGIGASFTLRSTESTRFTVALLNPDYLFSEYSAILYAAEIEGTPANMCGAGATHYTCQPWFRGTLKKYQSSRHWWKGSEPGHPLSIWSQQYNYARQAAMEWFVAHFGLDAAFNLAQALVGVTTRKQYYKVLDAYTELSHTELFKAIDGYVAPQFGLKPPAQ